MAPGQALATPAISICIANYNGADLIERCLDSVLAQQSEAAFEVLVHDDCSPDDSGRLVAERYPSVKLLTSGENLGFCRSNNRLADAARGDYLLLLNNDTRLHPGALEALYQAACNRAAPTVLTLPQFDMDSGELLDRGMWLDPFANPIPNLDAGDREVATVMGSCLWIPRRLWDEIGGLPEWFGSMAEDMYLCTCARLRGAEVRVVDESGYDHAVGQSFGGGKVESQRLNTSYQRRALSERNKNRVLAICFPGPSVLLLMLQLPLLLVEGTVLSLLKMSLQPLRRIYGPAVRDILVDSRRLRQWRHHAQAARTVSLPEFFKPIRFTHHKLWMLGKYGIPSIR